MSSSVRSDGSLTKARSGGPVSYRVLRCRKKPLIFQDAPNSAHEHQTKLSSVVSRQSLSCGSHMYEECTRLHPKP